MTARTIVFILLVPAQCLCAEWFVSTNGNGNGTIGSPWGLQTALTNNAINPGDTVWLRGGTYFPTTTNSGFPDEPKWTVYISGNTNELITLLSYSNEWAKIDRPWVFQPGGTYGSKPTYLKFENLEFYDSLKGSHPTNVNYPDGPWTQFSNGASGPGGTGDEWVNCVIHDVDNCWGYETSIRGCIIWHVGLNGYEHVNYPMGHEFVGNISAWHVNNVINLTMTNGATICSNIMFGAGQTVGGKWFGDLNVSDGSCIVNNNYIYNFYSTGVAEGSTVFGSYPSGDSQFCGNVVASRQPLVFSSDSFLSCVVTNNTLVMNSPGSSYQVLQFHNSSGSWIIDYNSYFARSPNSVVFRITNSFPNFASWKSQTGFDSHSTSSDSAVPTNAVYVIPNQDQVKRANIAVYNWSHADNQDVNVSSVLSSGDTYRIYNAQDYGHGAIQSGTFTGNTISLPMTNLTTAPVLYGTNWGLTNPPAMSPEFGAFVLIGSPGPSTLRVGTLRSP